MRLQKPRHENFGLAFSGAHYFSVAAHIATPGEQVWYGSNERQQVKWLNITERLAAAAYCRRPAAIVHCSLMRDLQPKLLGSVGRPSHISCHRKSVQCPSQSQCAPAALHRGPGLLLPPPLPLPPVPLPQQLSPFMTACCNDFTAM